MPIKHKSIEGDCIASIAMKYGFFPDTVWQDSANSELRGRRKNPNILSPGDVVVIPDKRVKTVAKPSDEHHKFRRRGVPEKLVIQLLSNDKPRASEEYRLEIDGQLIHGCTDEEGILEHWVPPGAKEGRLLVGATDEEYILAIGSLPPLTEEAGIQRRLANLGFLEADKPDDTEYKQAIEAFQSHYGLKVTGDVDQDTRDKILEEHGC